MLIKKKRVDSEKKRPVFSLKQNKLQTLWSRVRYFLALLRVRLFNLKEPVICILVVNNRCNFNCKYCFGNYYERQNDDYSTQELKTLIDDLYKMGCRYLNIHGGETLMRDDIGEIVTHIKSKGMYCCLITNGSMLPKKIDEIRGVDNITVSLDGTKENNDKNRGEGTFDAALTGIKTALEHGIPLRVSATITKHTMNDVGYLAKLAKEMNFTMYFSILFKPLPEAKDCEMTDEEIQCAMDELIKYKKLGYPVFSSEEAIKFARDWPLPHNETHFLHKHQLGSLNGFKPIKCYYGSIKFTIEADGNVYPCFLLVDDFKPLNWKEVGIQRAIEHVQKTNDCVSCPALSHSDHNLLLGLNPYQVVQIVKDQVFEAFRRY